MPAVSSGLVYGHLLKLIHTLCQFCLKCQLVPPGPLGGGGVLTLTLQQESALLQGSDLRKGLLELKAGCTAAGAPKPVLFSHILRPLLCSRSSDTCFGPQS